MNETRLQESYQPHTLHTYTACVWLTTPSCGNEIRFSSLGNLYDANNKQMSALPSCSGLVRCLDHCTTHKSHIPISCADLLLLKKARNSVELSLSSVVKIDKTLRKTSICEIHLCTFSWKVACIKCEQKNLTALFHLHFQRCNLYRKFETSTQDLQQPALVRTAPECTQISFKNLKQLTDTPFTETSVRLFREARQIFVLRMIKKSRRRGINLFETFTSMNSKQQSEPAGDKGRELFERIGSDLAAGCRPPEGNQSGMSNTSAPAILNQPRFSRPASESGGSLTHALHAHKEAWTPNN